MFVGTQSQHTWLCYRADMAKTFYLYVVWDRMQRVDYKYNFVFAERCLAAQTSGTTVPFLFWHWSSVDNYQTGPDSFRLEKKIRQLLPSAHAVLILVSDEVIGFDVGINSHMIITMFICWADPHRWHTHTHTRRLNTRLRVVFLG